MEHELYHYGILGMKWGIRRFQNKDGSLTAAGRKRYLGNNGKAKLEEDVSQINAKIAKLQSKNPSTKIQSEIDFLNKMKSGLLKNVDDSDIQKGKEYADDLKKMSMLDIIDTEMHLTKGTDLSDDDTDIPDKNKKLVEENNTKADDLALKTYKGLDANKAIDTVVNRLHEQLGGPDQVDDPELLGLVLMEEGDLLKRAGFNSVDDILNNARARFNNSLDNKKVSQSTENFFSDKSNKGKMDFDLRIENNPQCHALAERFMSGEFNQAIYQKILNETYDGYLDWCIQGDIDPVNKIDYVKGLRKAGFNSGGITFFPKQGMASLDLYVNDNDYFWGHVFGLEISDKHGVQKSQVRLEG